MQMAPLGLRAGAVPPPTTPGASQRGGISATILTGAPVPPSIFIGSAASTALTKRGNRNRVVARSAPGNTAHRTATGATPVWPGGRRRRSDALIRKRDGGAVNREHPACKARP